MVFDWALRWKAYLLLFFSFLKYILPGDALGLKGPRKKCLLYCVFICLPKKVPHVSTKCHNGNDPNGDDTIIKEITLSDNRLCRGVPHSIPHHISHRVSSRWDGDGDCGEGYGELWWWWRLWWMVNGDGDGVGDGDEGYGKLWMVIMMLWITTIWDNFVIEKIIVGEWWSYW